MQDDFGNSFRDSLTGITGSEREHRVSRRDAELRKFVSYWSSMRRDGDVPLRTEIDPRGIESLLSNAFIAEKIAPGLARLRIAGTHLSDVMGMEVRGMPLSTLIDIDDRPQLADALVELFERPAQVRLELAAPGGIRRAALAATLVILPLRSDLGDISRALGCFVSTGAIGATPRRFRIVNCEITPIDMTSKAPVAGFAEPHARFEPKSAQRPLPAMTQTSDREARHPSERPYLRLVHSD